MNSLIQVRKAILTFLVVLACVGLSPGGRAVIPPPDGGYPGANTAEGDRALLSLTSGSYNTAVGFLSLDKNSVGNFNTGIGAGALFFNSAGNENTAVGAGALLTNASPLQFGGNGNTADGAFTLCQSSTGSLNTAIGDRALFSNTTASFNTAIGGSALSNNTIGAANTAIGTNALANSATGSGNIALGSSAGSNITTASNVICISSPGSNSFNNACFIGNIFGVSGINGVQMLINSSGRVGAPGSSRRFKEDIKLMDDASEALYLLKPVCFRYKKEIDPQRFLQFGLVAEDVEQVNPDLVVRDNEGKTYSVRYDQINAMLLNEFLKEHKKTEKLEATVASLIATVKEQGAQIQKVSAQLEASKPSPQVVANP
jgi:trimeric autotransporter adhesin